jgi:hypothetical protein
VRALCRRIAFEARNTKVEGNLHDEYNRFSMNATEKEILHWLGDNPCVLFIDELKIRDTNNAGLYSFLKNFLTDANRFLIFSSHIVTSSDDFCKYCDGDFSNRPVSILELPLISTLNEAVEALEFSDVNERIALYLGLIPALIYEYGNKSKL